MKVSAYGAFEIVGDSIIAPAGVGSVATALPVPSQVSSGQPLQFVALQARKATATTLDDFDAACVKFGPSGVVATATNSMMIRPEDGVVIVKCQGHTHIAAIRTGAANDLSVVVTPVQPV